MPSRPLSADTKAVVRLQTRLDSEAMDIAKGRTDMPAAVARLVQLVPPARVDLVDEVMARIGGRPATSKSWPPYATVCELAWRVKRAHLGEVKMRGPNGEVVEVIRYRDKLGYDRRCYRLSRHGVFIGEYKTPQELGKAVDLAELVEDQPEESR